MTTIARRAAVRHVFLGAVWLAAWGVPACRAAEPVAFSTIAPDEFANFPVNWDDATTPVFRGLLRTPEEYAAVFHPAAVLGNRKPFAPPPSTFDDGMILVVARVIDAPAGGETPLVVESLTRDGDDLVLRYRFVPPAARATSTVKHALVLRLARQPVGRVRFVENGEPLGDLRVAAGEWAVPMPVAD